MEAMVGMEAVMMVETMMVVMMAVEETSRRIMLSGLEE
jgi:hypothetical protein